MIFSENRFPLLRIMLQEGLGVIIGSRTGPIGKGARDLMRPSALPSDVTDFCHLSVAKTL
jgi:hypothetical protein